MQMNKSTFGRQFTVTTWGESHGKALGAVVDGCPAGLPLCEEDIQKYLDRRKPGQSRYTTSRKEGDLVEILSGVFEVRLQERQFLLLSGIRINVPEITETLLFPIVQGMRIIPLTQNTVSGTIGEADALPEERPSGGWRQEPSPRKYWSLSVFPSVLIQNL